MNHKSIRRFVAYLVTLAFVSAPTVPAYGAATCSPAADEIIKSCEGKYNEGAAAGVAVTSAIGATTGDGAKAAANGQKNGADATNAIVADVAKMCKKDLDRCKSISCSTPEETESEKQACVEGVNKVGDKLNADAGQNQDTSNGAQASSDAASGDPGQTGGGGGGGDMGGMLMGAALGAGAMYLLNKKKKDKDKDKEKATNCTAEDSYKLSDCNDEMTTLCTATPSDAKCANFTARYCTAGTSTTATDSATDSSSSEGAAGEGIGTAFCKATVAANYCKTDGRSECPTCLKQAMETSATCKATPTLCLAQNSAEQIAAAKLTCPTDPMFADPNYIGGGAAAVAGVGGAGAPVAVTGLPDTSTTGAVVASSFQAASVGSSAGGVAVRDAKSVGTLNNGEAGSSYKPSSAAPSVSGGGARDVASGGSSTGALQADIPGRFGPSLFAMTSQVFQNRCTQGRLLNCTP